MTPERAGRLRLLYSTIAWGPMSAHKRWNARASSTGPPLLRISKRSARWGSRVSSKFESNVTELGRRSSMKAAARRCHAVR